jgi:hypothetical protein
MKLTFHLPFRRKPPKPAPPLTLRDGGAVIDTALEKTLKSGFNGFVLAMLTLPNSSEAQVFASFKGNIGDGLARALGAIMADPQTKDLATVAMLRALSDSGTAQTVIVEGGCQCPACTARRAEENTSRTPTTH